MKIRGMLAALSAAALIGQPCLAAVDFRDSQPLERSSGAFAGAVVKMELGRRQAAVPTARLQLGMTHSFAARGSAMPARVVQASALELDFAKGKPLLLIGGQDPAAMERRLGLKSTTGTILLVAAGVAAGGLLLLHVLTDGSKDCPQPDPLPPGCR